MLMAQVGTPVPGKVFTLSTLVSGINYKNIRILNRSDLLDHDISNALMLMIQEYVRDAHDLQSTPEDTWELIRDGVFEGDLRSILISYMPEGEPQGFMYCRMDEENPNEAVIHCAYAKNETPKEAIQKSLEMFEDWARFNKAVSARFYTFRIPGSHRLMLYRGWKHVITSYRKEL